MDGELKCGREAYWKELDDGKKIERMRGKVKLLEGRVERLISVIELLKRHHHLEGKIMVTLEDDQPRGWGSGGRPNNPDEVYF